MIVFEVKRDLLFEIKNDNFFYVYNIYNNIYLSFAKSKVLIKM